MRRLIDLTIHRRARAMGAYWDAVMRGSPSIDRSEPDDDPALADLILHIQRISDADRAGIPSRNSIPRQPNPMHREMIIMPASTLFQNIPFQPMRSAQTRNLPSLPWRGLKRGWASTLVAAAMLAVAIGVVSNPLGPATDWLANRNQPNRAAIFAPATPAPTAEETLLSLTLPNKTIPRGEGLRSILFEFSLQPGYIWSREDGCCPGPLVEYVVRGTYSVNPQAAVQIVRADGSTEDVSVGQEASLNPGDALISRAEIPVEMASTGSEPLDLLSWVLIGPGDFSGLVPLDIQSYPVDGQEPVEFPQGSATLRLKRVELEAGGVLPPSATAELTLVVTAPLNALGKSVAPATRDEDGEIRSASRQMTTIYVVTLEPDEAGASVAASPTP